jgi:hypothetical protein
MHLFGALVIRIHRRVCGGCGCSKQVHPAKSSILLGENKGHDAHVSPGTDKTVSRPSDTMVITKTRGSARDVSTTSTPRRSRSTSRWRRDEVTTRRSSFSMLAGAIAGMLGQHTASASRASTQTASGPPCQSMSPCTPGKVEVRWVDLSNGETEAFLMCQDQQCCWQWLGKASIPVTCQYVVQCAP